MFLLVIIMLNAEVLLTFKYVSWYSPVGLSVRLDFWRGGAPWKRVCHRFISAAAQSLPKTLSPKPQTIDPRPQTPNPKPRTPNPNLATPNLKPQTLYPIQGGAGEAAEHDQQRQVRARVGARNPKPEIRDPKTETRTLKPGNRDPSSKTRDPKSGTRNSRPEIALPSPPSFSCLRLARLSWRIVAFENSTSSSRERLSLLRIDRLCAT